MLRNYYQNNYESLIKLKPKHFPFILLFSIFIGGVLIWSNNINTYDILNTKGFVECDNFCTITSTISLENTQKLNDINYISFMNKIYDNLNYSFSDILYDDESKVNYQILTITINDNLNTKALHDLKIYYNQDRLLKKIVTMLFS